jgi:hypothetical protein|nr:MAG TPA: hypothetical protein [Caudoviricetes sp.]
MNKYSIMCSYGIKKRSSLVTSHINIYSIKIVLFHNNHSEQEK